MFFLTRTACLVSLLTLVSTPSADAISVTLADVKINGTVQATAAFGVISGNDNQLLSALNSGSLGSPVVGTVSTGISWSAGGKSDDASFGPFTGNPAASGGTLALDSPLFTTGFGNVAISLKAGNGYSVYIFENVSNVNSFDFTTQALANRQGNSPALSHASLFSASSVQAVPEPSTLMLVGVALIGVAVGGRRNWSKRPQLRCSAPNC